MGPKEDKQLREMAEAGKSITMIALRLKTNSQRCPRSIGCSQGLTPQRKAAPKEQLAGVNRADLARSKAGGKISLRAARVKRPFAVEKPPVINARL